MIFLEGKKLLKRVNFDISNDLHFLCASVIKGKGDLTELTQPEVKIS